jgi:hypothetical protein
MKWPPCGIVDQDFVINLHRPDHPQLVPKLRMLGDILPLPQDIFMAWYLIKHRDNFTLHSCPYHPH